MEECVLEGFSVGVDDRDGVVDRDSCGNGHPSPKRDTMLKNIKSWLSCSIKFS